MMRELLDRFASDYSAAEQKLSGLEDDQSSIHYPTVFLFIGDEAGHAIEPMIHSNELKWDNNAGVIYFHVSSSEVTLSDAPGNTGHHVSSYQAVNLNRSAPKVIRVALSDIVDGKTDNRTKRKDIGTTFHKEGRHLVDLNRALRQVSDTIADYGRLYASFDRLHLAVITRVDDPLNVLVPEISLLAQSIFLQLFKSVQMDMYALINEREQSESFGF
jgi:hypothetical protein